MIQIDKKRTCSGCGACASACPAHCIAMKPDREGFLYPTVDMAQCRRCGLCVRICPMKEGALPAEKREQVAYGAYTPDAKLREESSSGGVFSIIAEEILTRSGIVYGAAWDENWKLRHIGVASREQLSVLRGAKYLQSDSTGCFAEIRAHLENGRWVCFSGTPCQIGGLKAYLRKTYERLLCIDLICHGVPSPLGWAQYREALAKEHRAPMTKFVFRNKEKSWKRYSVSATFANGSNYSAMLVKDPYMRVFLAGIMLRPSCYACPFKGESHFSDLTIADFWGIENVLPELDDDKGLSLIVLHSDAAKTFFAGLEPKLVCQPVAADKALQGNQSWYKSVNANPLRRKFMTDLPKMPFERLSEKYCGTRVAARVRRKWASLLQRLFKKEPF